MPELDKIRYKGKDYGFIDVVAREQIAEKEARMREDHVNDIAELDNSISTLTNDTTQLKKDMDSVVARVEQEGDKISFYNKYDELIFGPFTGLGGGGGGGGSSEVYSTMTMNSEMEWTTTTIRHGASCPITVSWSSVLDEMPTGNGSLKVTVTANGGTKTILQRTVAQGRITVDVGDELTKNATNTVRIAVTDAYNLTRYRVFTVVAEEVSITTDTDFVTPKSSQFSVTVIPYGTMTKTIHRKLDGYELSTMETAVSGRPITFTVPAQTHGAHSLEIWYTAELNGEQVESNRIYNEFISFESGNLSQVISSNFNETKVKQFSKLLIQYMAYDPSSLKATVTFEVNGEQIGDAREVDRTQATFEYRVSGTDDLTITIKCGTASKTFNLTVEPSSIHPEAETDKLVLHLDAAGRSNSESNPAKWEYKTVSAGFTGFNWTRDGWIMDENGMTGLRCVGGSGITIPFQPYASDPKASGKTIEIEFRTHNVLSYDSPVISCMEGGRGFEIYADKAVFKSARSEIVTRFTTDQRLRITMTMQPRNADVDKDYRLLWLYIDGEYQSISQYSANDNFVQATPANITVGCNNACGVDLYNIRIYDAYLEGESVLMNFTADRQDSLEMIDLYEENDLLQDHKVVIDKLPATLPHVVFEGASSPQSKGDKKTVKFTLYDLYERQRTVASDAVEIDVQGTSSQYYYVKNFKIKCKNGVTLNGKAVIGFAIRDGEIVVTEFTLKADVASSESANNIIFAKLFNDLSKALGIITPPQQENSAVRQAVDGFPCVIFWDYGDGPEFAGKYNFNNDKGTFDTFGFTEGDEAWDVRSNTSQLSKFHTNVFPDNWYTEDYEAIYPDKYSNPTRMKAMTDFLYSTWQEEATGAALAAPVTYEGVTYTNDTAAYRLAKFKDGFPKVWSVDNAAFYFCYCITLMMVDSFQKNQHYVFWHSIMLWWIIFWDGDTALGNDNRGGMSFEYWVELFDKIDNENVFNGADNVMWVNFSQAFWPEIVAMYQRMRSSGMFSAEYIMKLFHEWQSAWPKAIWNADGHTKYVAPLEKEGTTTYLSMAFGKKQWQRDEILPWRFAYMDSWMDVQDALQSIMFRPYYEVTEAERAAGAVDIEIEVYKKSYVTVLWDSTKTTQRVLDDSQPAHVNNPLRYASDAVIAIHNGKMIKAVHGLPKLYVGYWDSTNAPNIQSVELGSLEAGYSNTATTEVSVGTNEKLTLFNLANCVNYGTDTQKVPNLSHCPNVRTVYLDGTKALGVDLPNGGVLETLHLPATASSIVVQNHPLLTDENFVVAGWSNVEQLWLENLPGVDMRTALNRVPAGTAVRLIGFTWECADAAEIEALLDKLDTMRGIEINAAGQGVEVDTAQVSGTIHTNSLTGAQIASYNNRYRYLTITADHTSAIVTFMSYDGTTVLGTKSSIDGADVTDDGISTSRSQSDKYTYTKVGWALSPSTGIEPNASQANANALKKVTADRTVYAAYSGTLRSYTAYFARSSNDGGGTLYTQSNVPYGTTPTYNGSTPTTTQGSASDYPFTGWSPTPGPITGNTTYYAVFGSPVEIKEITDSWEEIFAAISDGTYASKYSVGNYKTLDLDSEGAVYAQIVAKDADELADGSGYAPLTWVTKFILNTTHRMNMDYVTVYKYPDKPSWTASGKTWTSKNRYVVSTAKATWTISVTADGTLTVFYKTSNSNANYNKFTTLTVNGTAIATNYTNTTGTTETLNVSAGDTVTVYAEYDLTGAYDYYGTVTFGGTSTFSVSADVQDAPTREVDYYEDGKGAVGGWEKSEMRTSYLPNTILPKLQAAFPEGYRDRLKTVKKYSQIYNTSGQAVNNVVTNDIIWLPSYREIFKGVETMGPTYTALFKDAESRKKYKVGSSSAAWWWLRSASNYNGYYYVYGSGDNNGNSANYTSGGVVVGFCT